MRHDITQPKRVWVDSGKTTTWIASRRNLPKTFKSAPHPGTKLNLVWYVLYFMIYPYRDLKRWRNIMEKLTFEIQMSSRNTWSNSHHNIISYWAHRSLVSRRLLDNDYPSLRWHSCLVLRAHCTECKTSGGAHWGGFISSSLLAP